MWVERKFIGLRILRPMVKCFGCFPRVLQGSPFHPQSVIRHRLLLLPSLLLSILLFFFFLPDFLNWGEIPKESDTTEWLNWTVLNWLTQKNYCFKPFLSVHLSGIKYTHIVAYPSPPSISRTFLSSQTEPVPLNTDCPSPYSPRLWSPLFYLSILGYSRYLT